MPRSRPPLALLAAATIAGFALWPELAMAQSSPPPFRVDGGQAPLIPPASDGILGFIQETQATLFGLLREAAIALTDGAPSALFVLLGLSFAYGVFHAAGPGHGKVVLSTYLVAEGRTVRRGITLAFVAAIVQGAAAIILVLLLSALFSVVGSTLQQAAMGLELLSYAVIGLLGVYLVRRGVRRLRQSRSIGNPVTLQPLGQEQGKSAPHHHDAHHHHGHECGHNHQLREQHHSNGHGHSHHHHGHDHGHGHGHDCGHAHMPPPDVGWREGLGLAFAIGLRPCSGAILVLVFCLANGVFLAGGFAVLFMALGTALTTSALAALAVSGHHLILSKLDGSGAARLSAGLTTLAGCVLTIAGGLLLLAGPAVPPI